MSLQTEMITDILSMESDLGSPTFYMGATEYACVPSVNEITRNLEDGGFTADKLLSMVVRLQDADGNDTFLNNIYPKAQQIVTYNSENFRIITTKRHPTGAYMRIMAVGIVRGV